MRAYLVLTLLLAAPAPAVAQQGRREPPVLPAPAAPAAMRALVAARITGAGPAIDGRLNDVAWHGVPVASDFVQSRPRPGEPASSRTEIRVLYDANAVYVGARMYDAHPDSIEAQLTRRDQAAVADAIEVAIDSYHDHRTAYLFRLNSRGVKTDALVFEDTLSDSGWDAVWDGSARVDSLGWTAELRIPLSQLRFGTGAAPEGGQTWGIDFKRTIARSREESFWAPPPQDNSRLVSSFGSLEGLVGLGAPRGIELMPYTVGKLSRRIPVAGNPLEKRGHYEASAGADLKFGIASNLTLTATLNPDFGQVEADPSVVNLTAFESFFPEKRPFFLEGSDIFRFGIGLGSKFLVTETLVYPRRIGRPPQLRAIGADYSDARPAVPILGAAKLSGKTAGGWSIGVLDAVTGRASAAYVKDSTRGQSPVEPRTNYAVARVIRSGRAGQSAVGAVFTATHRQLNAGVFRDALASAAYTGGLDFRHRFRGGRYEVTGWLLGSTVLGSDSAMARRQREPAHYFHRPGAAHLTYDPTRADLSGWAAAASIGKIGGAWTWGLIENARSPGFDVNDLGYAQSSDMVSTWPYIGWTTLGPWHRFRQIRVTGDVLYGTTWGGEAVGRGAQMNVQFSLLNEWGGSLYLGHQWTMLKTAELRGGPALRAPANDLFQVTGESDARKHFGGSFSLFFRRYAEGAGKQLDVNATVWVRPSSRMEASLRPGASWRRSAWQYVLRAYAAGDSHYVLADLRQTTMPIETQFNYTFSPTLSFQLYAQPFAGTGRYTAFKELADPLAERFADRFRLYRPEEMERDATGRQVRIGGAAGFAFHDPDYGVRDMRSNAVLRWEYRPGSAFFLVWSQDRPAADGDGAFRADRQLRKLARGRARNVFLLKASYWLGR